MPDGIEGNDGKQQVDWEARYRELEGKHKTLETEHTTFKGRVEKAEKDADTAKRWLAYVTNKMGEADRAAKEEERQQEAQSEEERLRKLHGEDPLAAMDAHFRMRMEPVLNQHLSSQAEVMRSQARLDYIEAGKTPEEQRSRRATWDKYQGELDQFMGGMNPSLRSQKNAWLDGLQFVRSRHVDDEIREQNEAQAKRNSEMTEGRGEAAPTARPKRALNSLEMEIAKEFEMSPDEWREYGGGAGPAMPSEEDI